MGDNVKWGCGCESPYDETELEPFQYWLVRSAACPDCAEYKLQYVDLTYGWPWLDGDDVETRLDAIRIRRRFIDLLDASLDDDAGELWTELKHVTDAAWFVEHSWVRDVTDLRVSLWIHEHKEERACQPS